MTEKKEKIILDKEVFNRRLARLFKDWETESEDNPAFAKLECLVLVSDKQEPERPTPKVDQLHLWLFGYVFPETVMIFSRKGKKLILLGGSKKITVLQQLREGDEDLTERISFLEKIADQPTNVNSVVTALKKLVSTARAAGDEVVGIGELQGKHEVNDGVFASGIVAGLGEYYAAENDRIQRIGIDVWVTGVLSVLDETAVASVKKSAVLAWRLSTEVLIRRVEYVFDKELVESHASIVARAEKVLEDDKRQAKWQQKYGLDPRVLDIAYAIVLSGNPTELRVAAPPTDTPLSTSAGTVVVGVGTKYGDYTANVVRTLLFNASPSQKAYYQFVESLLDFAIQQLKPGRTMAEIHSIIIERVQSEHPELVPNMSRTLGHTLSIEFRDVNYSINPRCKAVVKPLMVFNISLGFTQIEPPPTEKGTKPFAIWLADTVLVKEDGSPEVLTASSDRRMKTVTYELADLPAPAPEKREIKHEAGEPAFKSAVSPNATSPNAQKLQSPVKARPKSEKEDGTANSVVLRDRLRSRNKKSSADEVEQINQRQRQLRREKMEELKRRVQDGETHGGTSKRAVRQLSVTNAYRDASEYPRELKPNRLELDVIKEVVFVPIPGFGSTPIHVAMLRNVFCQPEADNSFSFRIQLQAPGSTTLQKGEGGSTGLPEITGPGVMIGTMFPESFSLRLCSSSSSFPCAKDQNSFPLSSLRDLHHRSSLLDILNPLKMKKNLICLSSAALPQLLKNIKDLQRRIKQREDAGQVSHETAARVTLDLNRRGPKRIFLKGVLLRTATQSRRTAGTLEAHLNGFRFTGGRTETLDFAYANVKHAIFQPCKNEQIVLLHFHFKNAVVINNKRCMDIQFYTEVGSMTDDLDQRRGRSTYDPDELLEEQKERETRRKLNGEFRRFVEGVEQMTQSTGAQLTFDVPIRELGFFGVPKNTSVVMVPSQNCLVHLTEWPVFVLTLADIEIVSFERVYHGLRQFDMVFLFKVSDFVVSTHLQRSRKSLSVKAIWPATIERFLQDYSRQTQSVTTIPVESLEVIKRWLNEINIVWFESKGNLNWPEIMKTIREDFPAFVEEGGFEIFLGEDGGENEEDRESESDEDDEDYRDQGSESDSDDDFNDGGETSSGSEDADSDSDSAGSLASENESEAAVEGSDEEEGLSWDELEKRTLRDEVEKKKERMKEARKAKQPTANRKRPAPNRPSPDGRNDQKRRKQ